MANERTSASLDDDASLRGRSPKAKASRRLDPIDAAGLGIIAAVALVTGHVLRQVELYDDAGISFRYAQRFADGDGFTWNDHEQVMGYSNPLYTVFLGLARAAGLPMVGTARALGLVSFALAVVLAAVLAHRVLASGPSGPTAPRVAAVATAVVLIAAEPFRTQVLSGMEVGWTIVFGLGAILAASGRRQVLAGVLLGLALLTKLDAGLLAVPLGLMWWAVHRRWPWRMAASASAVLAPWLLLSTAVYGSPVPNSILFKLDDETRPFSRLWVLRMLASPGNRMLVLAVPTAAATAAWVRRGDPGRRLLVGALVGWALLQGLALSFVDLGADYPWYLTVIYPPLAIVGGAGLVRALQLLAEAAFTQGRPVGWEIGTLTGALFLLASVGFALLAGHDAGWTPSLGGVLLVTALAAAVGTTWRTGWHLTRGVATVAVVGLVLLTVVGAGSLLREVGERSRQSDAARPYELWEVDRRESGRQVQRLSEADEAIATCFGWVGYEAIDRVVSDVCGLNQVEDPDEDVVWVVDHGRPIETGSAEPVPPPGYRAAATISGTCERAPGWSWFTLWVKEGTDADERLPQVPEVPEGCATQ